MFTAWCNHIKKYNIKTNGEWIGFDNNNGVTHNVDGVCVYPTLSISQVVIGSYSKTNIELITTVSSDTKHISSSTNIQGNLTVAGTASATSHINTSDIRVKTNIFTSRRIRG
mgnify:CR=1 FL=1